MKQVKVVWLVIAMIGLITCNSVWAQGHGHGGGGGHYGGHYGGGHYGGGWHYGGGHWGYGHGGYYGGIALGLGLGYGLGYYGAPYYYPYYAPYYAYPPAVVTVPAAPQTYIQQAPPAVQQNPSSYWHYCNDPEGYYPYIQECPGGWQQVSPTPSAPR